MRAHLVQVNMAWERPEENFARVQRLLDGTDIRGADLVLLPEMFATGFSLNTDVTADDGRTLAFLGDLARRLGCWVQGGRTVVERERPKAHNRMSVMSPEGELTAEYTKVHPFSFGREPERFEGGREVVTWEWAGADEACRVCPAICYDLRFPELFRIGAGMGAEVFTIGACWPAARQGHWRALTIARAIENQAVVLAANRSGDDPHLRYAGGTIAIDARGEVLGELGDDEGVLSVDVDAAAARAWREQFPALRDARLDLRWDEISP